MCHSGFDIARADLRLKPSEFLLIWVASVVGIPAAMLLLSPILPALIPFAFGQYVVDSYVWHRQRQLRASFLGRWNGIFYFVPIVLVAAAQLPSPAGFASLSGGPWNVTASNLLNNKPGIFFYGFSAANTPFQGGTLCVQPPLTRTPAQNSGGNPPPDDCSGTMVLDLAMADAAQGLDHAEAGV